MTNLAVPTIHMNGTPKAMLIEPICDAIDALHNAGSMLAKASPNARDYYLQGPEAFTLAANQHTERMNKLRQVIGELEQIAMKID